MGSGRTTRVRTRGIDSVEREGGILVTFFPFFLTQGCLSEIVTLGSLKAALHFPFPPQQSLHLRLEASQ